MYLVLWTGTATIGITASATNVVGRQLAICHIVSGLGRIRATCLAAMVDQILEVIESISCSSASAVLEECTNVGARTRDLFCVALTLASDQGRMIWRLRDSRPVP